MPPVSPSSWPRAMPRWPRPWPPPASRRAESGWRRERPWLNAASTVPRMHLSDRLTGAVLISLGAVAAYAGSRLPPVPGQQVGPNVFPMVVGIGLALCGAMIMLGWGHSFEEEAEADLAAHTDPDLATTSTLGNLSRLKALLPPLLLIFYVFAADTLGFLLTAAVM